MRGLGFEPRKALSYVVLSHAHSTALASPLGNAKNRAYKKLLIYLFLPLFQSFYPFFQFVYLSFQIFILFTN